MTKPSFKEVLAQRQEYLDALKNNGDLYTRIFLEDTFLYHMDGSGLAPLTTSQHATMANWKASTQ